MYIFLKYQSEKPKLIAFRRKELVWWRTVWNRMRLEQVTEFNYLGTKYLNSFLLLSLILTYSEQQIHLSVLFTYIRILLQWSLHVWFKKPVLLPTLENLYSQNVDTSFKLVLCRDTKHFNFGAIKFCVEGQKLCN